MVAVVCVAMEEADYGEAASNENNSHCQHFVYPGDIDSDRINTNAKHSPDISLAYALIYLNIMNHQQPPHISQAFSISLPFLQLPNLLLRSKELFLKLGLIFSLDESASGEFMAFRFSRGVKGILGCSGCRNMGKCLTGRCSCF